MEQPTSPRIAILTISDRAAQGLGADQSGPALAVMLQDRLGVKPAALRLVPDEQEQIAAALAASSRSTASPPAVK